jgi:hypothetical protein
MRFEFPDVADFPENTEPRNEDDFEGDIEEVREYVSDWGKFGCYENGILSQQLTRVRQAQRMWEQNGPSHMPIIAKEIDTSPLRAYLKDEIEAVQNMRPSGDLKSIDRTKRVPIDDIVTGFLKTYKILDEIREYRDVRVSNVNLQVSKPGDRHHYQQFADCKTTTALQNLHLDPKPGVMKVLIYLNEVGRKNGPFQYIKSDHWDYDERIYAWGNSVGNYLHTPIHRRVANAFPRRYRANAIVGRLIPDDSPLSDFFLENLTTYTSETVMAFDPCFNFHRGGLCEEGERTNLQVVLK